VIVDNLAELLEKVVEFEGQGVILAPVEKML
jgi:hypothetical protein